MKQAKTKEEIKIFSEIAEKIKTLQSLPEEVVVKFLNSRGSLAATGFKNKFQSHAE